MSPELRIDPREARPIWRQIEESILRWVASGAVAAGEAIPSVRDLARQLRINPATVAKAYQRLTEAGMLETRRGEGTFVAEAPPGLTRAQRKAQLVEAAGRLATVTTALGGTKSEAIEALETALRELERQRKEPRG